MQGNIEESLDFLNKFKPEGGWLLTSIIPDGKATSRFFRSTKGLPEWVDKRQGKENIYFHVNQVKGELSRKASKEDILAMCWLHVDIDPQKNEEPKEAKKRALRSIKAFSKQPTLIIDSGGGLQAFWRLYASEELVANGDLERASELERYNIQLATNFNADKCHNLDRIMRLPGTINVPTKNKVALGRRPALAKVLEWNDVTYKLEEFKKSPETVSHSSRVVGDNKKTVSIQPGQESINVEQLLSWAKENNKTITDHTCALIATGQDPVDPTKYPSRSEALFRVCCDLVRAEVPDNIIYAVITGKNEIAISVLEKPNWQRYAIRQIERAKEDAIHPMLREMNEKHAVISDIGGKCRIISEVFDDVLGRNSLSKQSFADFGHRYCNVQVEVGQTAKGQPLYKPLGQWWINHPERRQYENIIFSPGKDVTGSYNLWRGFSFTPQESDLHESFLTHIKNNICSSDEHNYKYLIGWLAKLVQKPDSAGQVAVVLRGKKGTGKSFFVKTIGKLFGRHFLQVSDSKHLVGSFNAHLRDTILLFGDEAFFAGDKKHESILKTLITEEMIVIEGKGVDAEVAPNYTHLILASNEDWVIPAGTDERRFFMLEIGESCMRDFAYFEAIQHDLNNGGYSSLLYFLMNYDLSDFEVRNFPDTKALKTQKLLSMPPQMQWMFGRINEGLLSKSHSYWNPVVVKDQLYNDYIMEMQEQGRHYRIGRGLFSDYLASVMPEGYPKIAQQRMSVVVRSETGDLLNTKKRVYVYVFPELSEVRKFWDENFGGPFNWLDEPKREDDVEEQENF